MSLGCLRWPWFSCLVPHKQHVEKHPNVEHCGCASTADGPQSTVASGAAVPAGLDRGSKLVQRKRLLQLNKLLHALTEVRGTPLDQLDAAAQHIREHLDVLLVSVSALSASGLEYAALAASGQGADLCGVGFARSVVSGPGQRSTVVQTAVLSTDSQVLDVADMQPELLPEDVSVLAQHAGVRCVIVVPVAQKVELLGTLLVAVDTPAKQLQEGLLECLDAAAAFLSTLFIAGQFSRVATLLHELQAAQTFAALAQSCMKHIPEVFSYRHNIFLSCRVAIAKTMVGSAIVFEECPPLLGLSSCAVEDVGRRSSLQDSAKMSSVTSNRRSMDSGTLRVLQSRSSGISISSLDDCKPYIHLLPATRHHSATAPPCSHTSSTLTCPSTPLSPDQMHDNWAARHSEPGIRTAGNTHATAPQHTVAGGDNSSQAGDRVQSQWSATVLGQMSEDTLRDILRLQLSDLQSNLTDAGLPIVYSKSIALANTVLGKVLAQGSGTWISDMTLYLQNPSKPSHDLVLGLPSHIAASCVVAAVELGHGLPSFGCYLTLPSKTNVCVLQMLLKELTSLLKLLQPSIQRLIAAMLLVQQPSTATVTTGHSTRSAGSFTAPKLPLTATSRLRHTTTGALPPQPVLDQLAGSSPRKYAWNGIGGPQPHALSMQRRRPVASISSPQLMSPSTRHLTSKRSTLDIAEKPVPAVAQASSSATRPAVSSLRPLPAPYLQAFKAGGNGTVAGAATDAPFTAPPAVPGSDFAVASHEKNALFDSSSNFELNHGDGQAQLSFSLATGTENLAGLLSLQEAIKAADGIETGLSTFLMDDVAPAAKPQAGSHVAALVRGLQDHLREAQSTNLSYNLVFNRAEDLAAVRLTEHIAGGGFGSVFRGSYNGLEVAVKLIPASSNKQQPQREACELAVMTAISHPNVLQVLNFFTDVWVLPAVSNSHPAGAQQATALPRLVPHTPHLWYGRGSLWASSFLQTTADCPHPTDILLPPASPASSVISWGAKKSAADTGSTRIASLMVVDEGDFESGGSPRAKPATVADSCTTGVLHNAVADANIRSHNSGNADDKLASSTSTSVIYAETAETELALMSKSAGSHGNNLPKSVPDLSASQWLSPELDLHADSCSSSLMADDLHVRHAAIRSDASICEQEGAERALVIVMEFCDHGSLATAIQHGAFKEVVKGSYGALRPCLHAIYTTLLEVAAALRHLHGLQVAHCDLKPENILLKSSLTDARRFTVKLSDFGLARISLESFRLARPARPNSADFVGTVTHAAPELLAGAQDVDVSVDIYSFGILMWELYTGAPLYVGLNAQAISQGVRQGTLRPAFPSGTPTGFQELAERCWESQPSLRPSAEVVTHCLSEMLQAAIDGGHGPGSSSSRSRPSVSQLLLQPLGVKGKRDEPSSSHAGTEGSSGAMDEFPLFIL